MRKTTLTFMARTASFAFIAVAFVASSVLGARPPEQVHLALGMNATEMRVSWVTQIGDILGEGTSTVEYGTTPSDLHMTGVGRNYSFHDEGSLKRNFTVHLATMVNLVPTDRYYYRVGDAEDGWSPVYSFRATLPAGVAKPYTVAIYGDMGSTNAQALPYVEDEVANETVNYIIHVGDFAYDMYANDGKTGDDFMRQIVAVSTAVPYMTCLGNHEYRYNFLHYTMRFINMPSNSGLLPSSIGPQVANLPNNWYYSYDIGLVHYIAFSTEIYFDYRDLIETQWNWIRQDLESVNTRRNVTPWVVLYGHRSVYCSCDSDCESPATLVREGIDGKYGIEELNYKYGVDLFINAHEHDYERNYAVYQHQYMGGYGSLVFNPKATVYIITGSAGCREGHEPFRYPSPGYSCVRYNTFGYSRMTVMNSTHMYWQQIQTDVAQPEVMMDRMIDEMWLVQENHGSFEN